MYRLIYTLLLSLLMPLILLRLYWRGRSNPAYRQRIAERFGRVATPATSVQVWIHAVSVGETMAARPLIEKLIAEYGEQAVYVSTTTPTGSDTVRRLFADRVLHGYFPYDLPWLAARYLKRIQPALFISMETEIWPNFWHQCQRNGIPLMLANARLSSRSTRRYRRVCGFISSVLNQATLIACRNAQDKQHFLSLGVQAEKVKVVGDIKLDIQLQQADKEQGKQWRAQWGTNRPVLVAASTHQGEDTMLLDAFATLQKSIPDLLIILVPRHPERFAEVSQLIDNYGYKQQKRSAQQPFAATTEVILGDSMGEMMSWYHSADVVFVGGSLVNTGGHNPLEPLACQVPVVSGPHTFNFATLFAQLQQADAIRIAQNQDELVQQLDELLKNKQLQHEITSKGMQIIQQNKGATERIMQFVIEVIK